VSGGVVFTIIQKFMPDEKRGKDPELSKRRNINVIADEAHRSQYDLIDGLAHNLRDSLPERIVHRLHRHGVGKIG
jgi:type I restriction enzyme, R subunit